MIAGATVGAYVTIIGSEGGFASLAEREKLSASIFASVGATLLFYLFVVAAGMGTVFKTDNQARHRRVKEAAVLFYLEVFSVLVFAVLLTSAVFTDIPDDSKDVDETGPGSSQTDACGLRMTFDLKRYCEYR